MKIHNPPMTFLDGKQSEWDAGLANNANDYGGAVYRYASEWATRMEAAHPESVDDAAFAEMAKRTSHEADDEGITGFMYGCAVSMLAGWWIHGERLRRWHNVDTQIGTEGERANESGGVLNPALLNIG